MPRAKPFYNHNGLTVKDLREFLSNFPDDGTIWLANHDDLGLSNEAVNLIQLNRTDILISPRGPQELEYSDEDSI